MAPGIPPFPPSPVSKLSLFLSLPVCRRSNLLTRKGGGGGAKSYNSKKPGPIGFVDC
jgi:hypothetical protein